jgi:type I pantothenate kinase
MTQAVGMLGVAETLRRRRPAGCFIIGVTGAVASGKSTFAGALLAQIDAWPDRPNVALVCTDGFLFDNASLAARGLTLRKGFPEGFDQVALRTALSDVRREATVFPGYSHVTYDVDPALARVVQTPDVLIVEGLGLAPVRDLIDTLIYLDADEADIETWFVDRFMGFWVLARTDPTSFYARFLSLGREGASALARQVWRGINLPNLRDHIIAVRALADLVVEKGADHRIITVLAGEGEAGPPRP